MYIALEGPDASGKNTVAEYLQKHWYKPNQTPIVTQEPYLPTKQHSQIEKKIKSEPPHIQEKWYEYLRELHKEHILIPSVRNNQDIIHIRTFLSTAVYQIYLHQINKIKLREYINKYIIYQPRPKLIFILDTTYEKAQSRKHIEFNKTQYELIREGYYIAHQYLSHIQMTHLIDTTHKTVEEVGDEIVAILKRKKEPNS